MTQTELRKQIGDIPNAQLKIFADYSGNEMKSIAEDFGKGRPAFPAKLAPSQANYASNLKSFYDEHASKLAETIGAQYDPAKGYNFQSLDLNVGQLETGHPRRILDEINSELRAGLADPHRKVALQADNNVFLPPLANGKIPILSREAHQGQVGTQLSTFFSSFKNFDQASREKNAVNGIYAEAWDYYFGSQYPSKRSDIEKISHGWFTAMRNHRQELSRLGIPKEQLEILDKKMIAALKDDSKRGNDRADSIKRDFYKEIALAAVSASGGLAVRGALMAKGAVAAEGVLTAETGLARLAAESSLKVGGIASALGGLSEGINEVGEIYDRKRTSLDLLQIGKTSLASGVLGAALPPLARFAPMTTSVALPLAVGVGIHDEGNSTVDNIAAGKIGGSISHGVNLAALLLPVFMKTPPNSKESNSPLARNKNSIPSGSGGTPQLSEEIAQTAQVSKPGQRVPGAFAEAAEGSHPTPRTDPMRADASAGTKTVKDLGDGVYITNQTAADGSVVPMTQYDGREMIHIVKDGKGTWFYRSLMGTGGKEQGRWYPVGGTVEGKGGCGWIIKGDPKGDKGFGRKGLAALEDYVNEVLPHSDKKVNELIHSLPLESGNRQPLSYSTLPQKAPSFKTEHNFSEMTEEQMADAYRNILYEWKRIYLNPIWGERTP